MGLFGGKTGDAPPDIGQEEGYDEEKLPGSTFYIHVPLAKQNVN